VTGCASLFEGSSWNRALSMSWRGTADIEVIFFSNFSRVSRVMAMKKAFGP